jgi:hypothetical protein
MEVVAGGRLNAVVMWFDLHLAEGVALTTGRLTAQIVAFDYIALWIWCRCFCIIIMWFDLHLAEGVALTSGKACSPQRSYPCC